MGITFNGYMGKHKYFYRAKNLDEEVEAEVGDFITPILEKKLTFDVVICNPP